MELATCLTQEGTTKIHRVKRIGYFTVGATREPQFSLACDKRKVLHGGGCSFGLDIFDGDESQITCEKCR